MNKTLYNKIKYNLFYYMFNIRVYCSFFVTIISNKDLAAC